jgi:hypothetical protein
MMELSTGHQDTARENPMTASLYAIRERSAYIRAARTAIGHQLHAHYLPALAQPLPSRIRLMVARLAALESARRRSTEMPTEALEPTHAPQW